MSITATLRVSSGATSTGESAFGVGSAPRTRGPILLSRFMRAKYIGGSGCPSRMKSTNAGSLVAARTAALKRFS